MMRRLLFVLTSFLFLPVAVIASSGSSGPAVGTIAPDFSARNLLTGEKIPLSKQRGKVVILTFWASWCGPCRRELPILEKAQEIIGQDRLTVLAVSFHENPDAERGLTKLASTWHIKLVGDSVGWIADHYGISAIPHLFIIGRDGVILANHTGYGDRSLQELVDDINHALEGTPLAEAQPSSST
jgi:thiol-disulfide isomerase/thioredoxin